MAQIKSKQIKLVAEGDFIIGDSSANGSILSVGAISQVIISNGTTGAWGYLGDLRDPSGTIVVNTTTTPSQVNNIAISGGAIGAGPTFTATGTDTNIDINLIIKGSGEVLVPVSYTVVSNNALTTKQYVDSVATGLDFKNSARLATISSSDLTGFIYTASSDTELVGAAPWTSVTTPTFDGVLLVSGDRVLIKNATDPKGNGLFTYDSGTSTFIRANDADNAPGNEVSGGMFVFVEEGTQADTGWVVSSPDGIATLGTSSIILTQFSSAGVVTPGFGLSQAGTDFNVNVDDITTTIDGANAVVVGHKDSTNHSNQVLIGQDATGGQATALWDYLEDLRAITTGNLIIDGVGVLSSVNQLTITNAATGTDPSIVSSGTDLNIGLEITAKGTGRLKLDGTLWPDAGVPARSILVTQGTPNDLAAISAPDATGDQILLYNDTTNLLEWVSSSSVGGAVFKTVAGDTGSAIADNATDTLTISGGTAITTIAADNPEVLTINLDITSLTPGIPPVVSGDEIVIYDVSASTHVKVTVNQFFDDIDVGTVKYDDISAIGGANESFVAFFSFTPLSNAVITVFFNGIALRDTGWTRSGTTLTLVDIINGYSTESGDIISARYETAP